MTNLASNLVVQSWRDEEFLESLGEGKNDIPPSPVGAVKLRLVNPVYNTTIISEGTHCSTAINQCCGTMSDNTCSTMIHDCCS